MTMPSLVIIGAGLAGLSAAQHALRSGYDVTVFEHNELPGGVCTAWERAGYTFDGCVQWLLGGKPGSELHALYEDVGIPQSVRLLPITMLKRIVDEGTNTYVDITKDLARLERDLAAIAPEDAPLLRDILGGVTSFEGYERPVGKPAELAGPLDVLQKLWRSRGRLRAFSRFNMPVAELVGMARHPLVEALLSRSFVPEIPAYYLVTLLAQLADGQLSIPEGGSYKLASAVAQRALELGAKFHFGADVQEILVEKDRAVGIRLAGGFELRADAVISTAPGHTTLFRMLGGRYVDKETRERYLGLPLYPGIALVSFGLRVPLPPDTPPLITVALAEPLSDGAREIRHVTIRTSSHDPTLAPKEGSVVQVMMEADYDFWTELHHSPRQYARAKSNLVQTALDVLDRHLPFARASVALADVATPYTFWRFARSYRGAYGGFLPTLESMRMHIPKKLTGLERFYMAGQWVEPGGGVPTAILSGRQVVELVCHDDGRIPFGA